MSASPKVDLGIDAHMARKIRTIILSGEPLPPSGRNILVNHGIWDHESVITYGKWLCTLLELKPGKTDPITKEHFRRASKLNLGPSTRIILDNVTDFGEMKEEIGFDDPSYRLWSRNDYGRRGKRMATRLGRRPTWNDLREAHERGRFPGEKPFLRRFGSLVFFHEFIGYPRPYGWSLDDYLDWGVAVKLQNGLGVRLTKERVNYLSRAGRGPSDISIRKNVSELPKFDQRVEEEYAIRMDFAESQKAERYDIACDVVNGNAELARVTMGLEEDEFLRVVGQYRLIEHFGPPAAESRLIEQASIRPDFLARWLVRWGAASSVGAVESAASMLGVFDDLWPMYRFQNVDLRLPEAA